MSMWLENLLKLLSKEDDNKAPSSRSSSQRVILMTTHKVHT